jgi:hypothetical protein
MTRNVAPAHRPFDGVYPERSRRAQGGGGGAKRAGEAVVARLLKAAKGLYQFFKDKYPPERKSYNLVPPLLEKKYLKTIINCHSCAGTIDPASPIRLRVRRDHR